MVLTSVSRLSATMAEELGTRLSSSKPLCVMERHIGVVVSASRACTLLCDELWAELVFPLSHIGSKDALFMASAATSPTTILHSRLRR